MNHPFLEDDFHIRWSKLQPESIVPDIEAGLERAEKNIEKLAGADLENLTFENTLLALEDATEELSDAWGKVAHLTSVNDSKPLREAYNRMLPKVSEFFTKIPLNEKLWKVLKKFEETAEAAELSGARRRFFRRDSEGFSSVWSRFAGRGEAKTRKNPERAGTADAEIFGKCSRFDK